MLQESRLTHDQQMAKSADMVIELLHLSVYLIGSPGEHDAGLDRALHAGGLAESAQRMFRAAQHRDVGLHRHIARGIGEVWWHLVRRDIPQQLFGPNARIRLVR